MGVQFIDQFGTILAAGITDSDVTAQLVSVAGLPDISGAGDYFYLTFTDLAYNREVVKVTTVTDNVITMVRAQSGTARAFSAGDSAQALACAPMFNDLRDQVKNTALLGGAAATELTLSSGVIVPDRARHLVDTEADAASDDLADILMTNLGAGAVLILSSVNAGRDVVVKHDAEGAANPIILAGAADVTLADPADALVLEAVGTEWRELGRLGVWALNIDMVNAAIASGTSEVMNLLAIERVQRMIGDSVAGREQLGNFWMDVFGDATSIDAGHSSGYAYDASGDFVSPSAIVSGVVVSFGSDTLTLEDVKGPITALVVDTANASGHFTDGADNMKLVGGVSSDLCTGGTIVQNSWTSPANAFDGNTGTTAYIGSNPGVNYIGYTFAAEHTISRVKLYQTSGYSPSVIIQAYYGAAWHDVETRTAATGSNVYDLTTPVTCTGIRFMQNGATVSGANWVVAEIDAFETIVADAPKVSPGCKVRLSDDTELVVTGVTNYGDGSNEVTFSGTVDSGSHTVTSITGLTVEDGALKLNTYSGGQVQIAQGVGTPIGNMTDLGGLAAAFDGNNNQAGSASANTVGLQSTAYVGKDWGVGTTNAVNGVKVWGGNTGGYADNGAAVNLYLYGSNTAPTGPQDGTLLGTIASNVADTNTANPQVALSGFDTSTAYRYHWVNIRTVSGSWELYLAEVEFYKQDILVCVDDYHTATPVTGMDTTNWSDINGVTVDETLNSQTALYALSFDGGVTWKGMSLAAVAYPCPSDGAGWLTGTALAALADSAFPTPSGNVFVAVALKSTSASQNPSVTSVTINVDALPANMTLQFDAFTATSPDYSKVLLLLEETDAITLNTDLKALVSRDGGTTWEEGVLALDLAYDASTNVVVADDVDLTAQTGTSTVLKLTSHNNKSFKIHALSNSFRSAS